ncbi:hypothetical protein [Chitinophaga sp. 212800010-3]|uniref:DUF6892 domain-containing protein n=1 Tax=unclassified Chitinophaga TaxID=2619133 RepID=UPI002DF0C122|nr:BAH domain-containing protein [Chitinophaga sp. 212800010-3]
MEIAIAGNQLLINGAEIHFPVDIQQLKTLLGEARYAQKKYNHIYTWDQTGLVAFSKKGKVAESLALFIRPHDLDYSPASLFALEFNINGTNYPEYYQQHIKTIRKVSKYDDSGTLVAGDFDVWIDIEDNEIASIVISHHEPEPPKVYSDKYQYQKINGAKIEFADFNFKLAVIQELMYEKKLLKPEFDLYDFVENYREREIDVEKEGYGFIPEVTAYFEALEIDAQYADEITDIQQDGGNDIYGHVFRFWDGEDDTFNITNFEDTRHFKNLKTMTLFYADNFEEIKSQLAEKGITVDPL